ncbi:MAG: hypothetical protein ACJAVK_002573 [Akkermansiaceae bacterium]|jgi:hypothetical protein
MVFSSWRSMGLGFDFRQRVEQKRISSQLFSHFLRHSMARPQVWQILSGFIGELLF